MKGLKVPIGWPPVPPSLEAMSTMKLEQALSFAGDTGRYIIELLDIDPTIHEHMQAYLRVLRDCQQKTPLIPVHDIKARLDSTAAALEALLPAFWCTITKHFAIHLDLFQEAWGCFWAANELIHERVMAKLKRLAKHGNRNRMATLRNNWDIFQTANDWLLDEELKLHYKAHLLASMSLCLDVLVIISLLHVQVTPSSVAAGPPIINWSGNAEIEATTWAKSFDAKEFVQVQQAWAVIHPLFALLLGAYKRAMKNIKRAKPTLSQWILPKRLLDNHTTSDRVLLQKMKSMSPLCKVRSVVLVCRLLQ